MIAAFFLFLATPPLLHGHSGLPTTLKGPAFANPEEVATKEEAWQKQPIRYNAQDMGAEVVVLLDQNNYPGLLPLIQAFARKQQIKVVVREGTCGPAIEGLQRKEVDIGGSCCPPAAADRLPGLRWHTIGIAPLAILANAGDPITQLSAAEVRSIFRGEWLRWSQVPSVAQLVAKDLPIHPIIRFHCKTRPGHWRLLLDNKELFSSRADEVGSMLDMVTNIAKRRGTLGYEENWHTINQPRFRGKVKTLAVDGFHPHDRKAVASGKYPFYFTYNVSTWSSTTTSNAKASQLVEYLLAHAEEIDPSYHVVPASELKKQGWQFKGDELIGEPPWLQTVAPP
ncbi:substrate-binding domain-containing protein [Candidatus Magnetaquicoccus inordinatus]|uniref:substrate-binding domain-containing protein n=1 Tax=Candidatus Magnetaquicoccus inordinatus TaxID=2496818 RepID=UPI00187D40C8|nr:substrate-binding domain-containing protein [Candidatus Magnetaquicoccus inordinatus]